MVALLLYVEIPQHFDLICLQHNLGLVHVPFVCSVQPIHTTQFPMNNSGDIIMYLLIVFLRRFAALANNMGNTFTSLVTQFLHSRDFTLLSPRNFA